MSEPSANSKIRLLGEVATSDKPAVALSPRAPAQSAAPPVSITPPPPAASVHAEPIFLGDSADGTDVLNSGQIVQPLAQLCVTPQVQTPFLAAILGPSGAGKTFALRRLAQTIEHLGASSGTASGGALSKIVMARVDASSGVEAPVAIASAAYSTLDREPGGVDYSGLLDEIGQAGGDPQRSARAASDRHEDLVRKLEAERSQRDDVEARRARLADTLAFDTPGSRIDVFARARRGTIEGAVAPVRTRRGRRRIRATVIWRATCRRSARAPAPEWSLGRYGPMAARRDCSSGAFSPSCWPSSCGFCTATRRPRAIEHGSDSLKPAGDWVAAHGDWFDRAAQVLFILGALAIALNFWRALQFSNLLLRGGRLLTHEVRDRRNDLDSRVARLNQRVAALTAEAEMAANRADAASKRVGGKTSMRAPGPEFLELGPRAVGVRARIPSRAEPPDRALGHRGAGAGSAHRRRRQPRCSPAGRSH